MKFNKTYAVLILLLFFNISGDLYAAQTLEDLKVDLDTNSTLTEYQKEFIYMENFANNFIKPQNRKKHCADDLKIIVPLQYYKIPLSFLDQSDAVHLPLQIKNALSITEITGEGPTLKSTDYVKWFVYPEDCKYVEQTKLLLKAHGMEDKDLVLVNDGSLTGYLTASRSVLIKASNGAVFSAKVSTDYVAAMKPQEDKIVHGNWALECAATSDVIYKYWSADRFKSLILQKEPLALSIPGKDAMPPMGLIVRDLEGLATGDSMRYIPGFTVMDNIEGTRIALRALKQLNKIAETDKEVINEFIGSSIFKNLEEGLGERKEIIFKQIRDFWKEAYIIPLAKASAELIINYGITMTSAHNQQNIILLNNDYTPTGKIIIRDFTDAELYKNLLCEDLRDEISKNWAGTNYDFTAVKVLFGVVHMIGRVPEWMRNEERKSGPYITEWAIAYFDTYERTIKKRLNYTGEKNITRGTFVVNTGGYTRILYDFTPLSSKILKYQREEVSKLK